MAALPIPPIRVAMYLFFPGKGIGRYAHELCTRMHAMPELRVELLGPRDFEWRDEADYPVWNELMQLAHPWPLRRKANFLAAQAVSPLKAIRRAQAQRVDILHVQNINHLSRPLWWPAAKAAGFKIAATAHDIRRGKAILHRGHEERQLRRFYETSDALFVHSKAQRDDLLEFADVDPARVHEVPHGPFDYGEAALDKAQLRAQRGLPADKQIALFFGNIRDDKNLGLLIEAMPKHAQRLHLVVAGSASDRDKGVPYYKALAERVGASEAVTFFDGFIPDEEVPELFALCDWVALPYTKTFSSMSGVLNVAVQYRRPMLTSGAPTLAESLAQFDVGLFVEPDVLAPLEQGIADIMKRVQDGHQHAFDAYVEHFGWEENLKRTLAVYRNICGYDAAR